jgi:hypothetical protein
LCCAALGCRAGKELALAARQEDELKLKRLVEARQREKEEEARAREKIKIKLGAQGEEERLIGGTHTLIRIPHGPVCRPSPLLLQRRTGGSGAASWACPKS